jgi:5-methyltetrahydrofolate--homocysteine methyltransferase
VIEAVREEYAKVAASHARSQANRVRLELERARENALETDWTKVVPTAPKTAGLTTLQRYSVAELVDFIDWTPFFSAWELRGKFPEILDDPKVGEAARNLYSDARAMLDRIISEDLLQPEAVIGLWPANAVGDDIVVFADETRARETGVFHTLRQQRMKQDDGPNFALADFIAPIGVPDYIGGFVVTAGTAEDVLADALAMTTTRSW